MAKPQYEDYLNKRTQSVIDCFDGLLNKPETICVKDIQYDDNFKDVIVWVDRARYDNDVANMVSASIGLQAKIHQILKGDEIKCSLTIKYSDDGETISTHVFPDSIKSE